MLTRTTHNFASTGTVLFHIFAFAYLGVAMRHYRVNVDKLIITQPPQIFDLQRRLVPLQVPPRK